MTVVVVIMPVMVVMLVGIMAVAVSIAQAAGIAVADLDLAKLNLERSEVRAAVSGVVTNNELRPGTYLTTGKGVITAFPQFAEIDASSGDPMMIEFTVQHGGWTKSAVP